MGASLGMITPDMDSRLERLDIYYDKWNYTVDDSRKSVRMMMYMVAFILFNFGWGSGGEGLVSAIKNQQRQFSGQHSASLKIRVLENFLSYRTKCISEKYKPAVFSHKHSIIYLFNITCH